MEASRVGEIGEVAAREGSFMSSGRVMGDRPSPVIVGIPVVTEISSIAAVPIGGGPALAIAGEVRGVVCGLCPLSFPMRGSGGVMLVIVCTVRLGRVYKTGEESRVLYSGV